MIDAYDLLMGFIEKHLPDKLFIQLGRVDELGSGVLNVHRLINQYAGKGKPLFIEDAIFTMEIPVPNMQSEGAFEGINEGLITLLETISVNPGLRTTQLASLLNNRPLKTVEGQIRKLIILNQIKYVGSKKTGGYYKSPVELS